MKRQFDTIKEELRAVGDALPKPELPKSLSAEAVEDLVTGVGQIKPVKRIVRRAVAGALAACVAVCGIFVLDAAVYAPSIKPGSSGVAYVNDYSKILSLMRDYKRSEEIRRRLGSMNGSGKAVEDEKVAFTYNTGNQDERIQYSGNDFFDANSHGSNEEKNFSYSKTNTRVDGIDEADSVKTDGKNLYVAKSSRIYIIKLLDGGKLEKLSELTPLQSIADPTEDGSDSASSRGDLIHFSCRAVYDGINGICIDGTRLIAEFSCIRNGKQVTGIALYDISEPSSPVLKKTVLQDGAPVSSRVVGKSIVLVSQKTVYLDSDINEDVIPEKSESTDGTDFTTTKVASGDIAIADTDCPDSFLVVSKTDISSFEGATETASVLGSVSEIYCNDKTLFSATECYDKKTEKAYTKLISFDITGEKPTFKASSSVQGSCLDTFSMDEYGGYVRIATQGSDGNRVYVLDGELKEVGKIENIAPGEVIKAVRFSGNTGYVVTFYQTDPLFVLDLSEPTAPVIKGELKLPGFSEYLHPVGDGLLLGIGTDGTENGINSNAKLSLFDVSDPSAPKEADTLKIKNASLETEYKAFVADPESNTFLVPYTCWKTSQSTDGDVTSNDTELYTGIVRIAVENGCIVRKNDYEINGDFGEIDDSIYQISRIAFVGDTVYGIDCYGYPCRIVSFDSQSGTVLERFTVTYRR